MYLSKMSLPNPIKCSTNCNATKRRPKYAGSEPFKSSDSLMTDEAALQDLVLCLVYRALVDVRRCVVLVVTLEDGADRSREDLAVVLAVIVVLRVNVNGTPMFIGGLIHRGLQNRPQRCLRKKEQIPLGPRSPGPQS